MVLNHAEESYSDRLSLHSRRYVQYGYSWVDRVADNAYPRRILKAIFGLFLLDGQIEQIQGPSKKFLFLLPSIYFFFTVSFPIVFVSPV